VANLLDALPQADGPEMLELVRLSKTPTLVQLFTADGAKVRLHYEEDETVRSYLPCPGDGCPLCYLGRAAEENFLLPAVSIKTGQVGVLRISLTRSPWSLAAGITPHLDSPDIADKVFEITRDGNRYRVQALPLGEDADRNERAIKGYLAACENGLRPSSALPEYTVAELAEVPSIRRLLNARGGWKPPQSPQPIEAAAAADDEPDDDEDEVA
jgi:hypothetical protein